MLRGHNSGKSQEDGDQKKIILCQKKSYFGMFYNISLSFSAVVSGDTCFEKVCITDGQRLANR